MNPAKNPFLHVAEFLAGVPYCYNKLTQSQKERFSMRQKQIVAAKKLNKSHIFQKDY